MNTKKNPSGGKDQKKNIKTSKVLEKNPDLHESLVLENYEKGLFETFAMVAALISLFEFCVIAAAERRDARREKT